MNTNYLQVRPIGDITMIFMRHWLSTFSRFGMLVWIFATIRNGSVFVGVHMETFRLFNFWNVGPNVNFGQISKNTHKKSNKIFATKPNGQMFTIKTPKASLSWSRSSPGVSYFAVCCMPLCYLCSAGFSKLRPAGQMRLAKLFHPASDAILSMMKK